MLEELTDTIERLKARIKEHKEHIQVYESRTRTALIDPLLCSLGWDVSDPSKVTIEPRTDGGWADYALLDDRSRTVVFVEAKRLSDSNLHVKQTIGYAISENMQGTSFVRYCAFTNGDVWELYDLTTQRPVLKASVVSDETAKCALQLLGLWRASMGDRLYSAAVEPVVDGPGRPLYDPAPPPPSVNPPDPVQPAAWTAPPAPASHHKQIRDEGNWSPLSEATYSNGDPAPLQMRFPDDSVVSVTTWYDLMVEATRWLSNSNLLQSHHCPIFVSRKRYLVSTTPYHPGGKPMRTRKEVNSLYVEAHYQAIQCIRNARSIIEKVGQDPAQFHVQLR